MIYFDVTRSAAANHRSGLTRVGGRLRAELGEAATGVAWRERSWREAESGRPVTLMRADWLLTPELFCEAERPGWWDFLRAKPCRLAAIFHDAIPLKLPHITWPQSVSRHPEYMKMLAGFDRVFAVSAASGGELVEFWRWQGAEPRAEVETLALGADFQTGARAVKPPGGGCAPVRLLCVGILEPRKNQGFLLEVCDALWAEGVSFELHLVGRVNPHFGRPLEARLKAQRKIRPQLKYHAAADDRVVAELYRGATATVFPTIAEGCGLPLLESLWLGTPCFCSDLPVLRENADGGCVPLAMNDLAAWKTALRRAATDPAWIATLQMEAARRALPTWAETAAMLRRRLQ